MAGRGAHAGQESPYPIDIVYSPELWSLAILRYHVAVDISFDLLHQIQRAVGLNGNLNLENFAVGTRSSCRNGNSRSNLLSGMKNMKPCLAPQSQPDALGSKSPHAAVSFLGEANRTQWATSPVERTSDHLLIAGHPVMSGWESPYMSLLSRYASHEGGRVLEIGFGMGISADFLHRPEHVTRRVDAHVIVEAHPIIYQHALAWRHRRIIAIEAAKVEHDKFSNHHLPTITIHQGWWQHVCPQFADGTFDGILFDSYPVTGRGIDDGTEHHDFFVAARRLLRPGGVFTFFTNEPYDIKLELRNILLRHGFTVEDGSIANVNPKGSPYWAEQFMYGVRCRKILSRSSLIAPSADTIGIAFMPGDVSRSKQSTGNSRKLIDPSATKPVRATTASRPLSLQQVESRPLAAIPISLPRNAASSTAAQPSSMCALATISDHGAPALQAATAVSDNMSIEEHTQVAASSAISHSTQSSVLLLPAIVNRKKRMRDLEQSNQPIMTDDLEEEPPMPIENVEPGVNTKKRRTEIDDIRSSVIEILSSKDPLHCLSIMPPNDVKACLQLLQTMTSTVSAHYHERILEAPAGRAIDVQEEKSASQYRHQLSSTQSSLLSRDTEQRGFTAEPQSSIRMIDAQSLLQQVQKEVTSCLTQTFNELAQRFQPR